MSSTLTLTPGLATRRGLWLAAGSGVVSGIAFTQELGGPLLWFSLAPFFLVLWSGTWTWSRIWRICLAWTIPYNLFGMHFLSRLHSLEWRGLSWGQSLVFAYLFSWVGVTLLVVPALIAWGFAVWRLAPVGVWRLILPPALWVLMEWGQRHVPLAMPWNTLSVSQVPLPAVIQIAAVTGSLGVSALMILVNNALALALLERRWRWFGGAMALGALNALGGAVYLWSRPVPATGTGVPVQVVQGNIRPDQNWQPSAVADMLATYEELTMSAASGKPRVIVWPESALPVDLPHTPWLLERLREVARRTRATLIVGTLELRPEDQRMQNDMGFLDPDGAEPVWYRKRHLVPFGEYTPGGAVLKPILLAIGLSAANTLPADAMPGTDPGPVQAQGIQWGPVICFESIFPDVVREAVLAGAEALVEVTNDAWFKDSIALVQHNHHAALRAVEHHRYMVRSTITGISSIIDPYGRMVARSMANLRVTLGGEVWPQTGLTPAARWGDWWVACCALVATAGAWRRRARAS